MFSVPLTASAQDERNLDWTTISKTANVQLPKQEEVCLEELSERTG